MFAYTRSMELTRLLLFAAAAALLAAPASAQTGETTASSLLDPIATERVTSATEAAGQRLSAEAGRRLRRGNEGPTTAAQRLSLRTTESRVLATWTGGELTTDQLSATIALRRTANAPSTSIDAVLALPPDRLAEVIRDVVYEELMYERAKQEGITAETTGIRERIQQFRSDALNKAYYDLIVYPKLEQMDEKRARDYYEENKNRIYTIQDLNAVREIWLSAYKLYTVKEGDTIDKIAERESGDVQAAIRILRMDPYKYPRLSERAARGDVPFVQPKPGEKLLVPLNKDERTSKAALAARIAMEATPANFMSLIDRYSDSQSTQPKPFLMEPGYAPELRGIVEGLDKDDITSPVEHAHGWSIFHVADKQLSRTLTYEEVRERNLIPRQAEEKRRSDQEVINEMVSGLITKHKVEFNEPVLKRGDDQGTDPLTADTWVARTPGFTYTLGQMRRDLTPAMRTWNSMNFEERLQFVKTSPTLLNHLSRVEAEALGLDKTEDFRKMMHSKEVSEISAEYMKRLLRPGPPKEEELREYYNQHLDKYTSPALVTVREITRRVNLGQPPEQRKEAIEKAKKELGALRSQIRSLADFEQTARRESQALSTRAHGGFIGTVPISFRGEMFRNELEQLQPGQVSEPFLYGAEVMIVRLDDSKPPLVRAFDEVRWQVRVDFMRETPRKRFEEDQERTLREANFQLKI